MQDVLRHWTPELAERLGEVYRDLHRHPELSLREHRTADRVAAALGPLGCEVATGIGGTGVVAVLRNGDGPVVMLRADMDALPVAEETGLPYASTARGVDESGAEVPVMHACGHDMHVACLLGALETLARGRAAWSGTVLAVFQPAEELVRGAQDMIDDGLFERFPRPEVVLGQHVAPLPAGTVGYGEGPVMAAGDSVQVTLFGRGGHGARPEDTVDPVVMAAAVVMRLQGIVAREVPHHEKVVLTVGRLHAGHKDNVIPDTAELGIGVRSFDPAVRDRVRAAVERVVRAEAAASGADREPAFAWKTGAPVLVSDPRATAVTAEAFRGRFGADRVVRLPSLAASEDVGRYGEALGVPTVFWFWGGAGPGAFAEAAAEGRLPPFNHSPRFAPVLEPTLTTGVQALTVAALTWLAAP
ncbi:M20 family metallopeptidase [Actinomadura kijaniata]|uniref:Hippurate hydrolase n=1 Tax=Actinomadura namibiensis TaxID=182080 RepID=A0A7W3QLX0_ACTNM|nr:amidohydrolase [Actinomadura namibiensis]MBA8951942.1 hippurate hydrolase [Actinomadura namibiensis]